MPKAAGIYYSLFSKGRQDQKPVVLLHGAGSSHLSWPAELRRLPGRTVYALDLPGHGASTGVGYQSVAGYCGTLIEFMAELGMYQAIFVGHSLGGAIALNLAADFPQHVAGLGLISSGAFFNLPPHLLDYLSNPASTSAAIQTIHELTLSPYTSQALALRSKEALKATRTSVLYNDWTACAQFDLRSQMAKISVPVYIACGREDRFVPPAQSRYLAENIPETRVEVVAKAGHLVMLEQTAAIVQGFKAYLQKIEAWQENYTLPIPISKEHSARKSD